MARILVVEDEAKIARFIELELSHEGYEVDKAEDGRAGLELALAHDYDLILLDIMLPQISGMEVLRRLRREKATPVILLTARDAIMDKVAGLDAGADDYITKPFAIEELLARIRVSLKRRNSSAAHVATEALVSHGVSLDVDRHEVSVGGEPVELTNREFEILHALMAEPGIVQTRDQLASAALGYDYIGESNVIDVYIRQLRSKIDDRFGVKLITTVRGVGYVIRD